MISYLGSASSVQSCCGEGGALQTDIAVCGEHSPCSGHTGFAPLTGVCAFPSTLLRLPAALYGAGPALSAVPVFGSSTTARIWLRLRVVSSPPQRFRQPEACAPSPQRGAPFPSAAPARAAGRVPAAWFVLRSWPLAATLPVADSQESIVAFKLQGS